MVALATVLNSCSKNNEVSSSENSRITVDLLADLSTDTKSSFGDIVGNSYPSTWSGAENVAFSLNGAAIVTSTPNSSGKTTSFTVSFDQDGLSEGKIYAVSPYHADRTAGCSGINSSYNDFYVTIPANQTPAVNSCDETAHILFGEASYSGNVPTSLNMNFSHIPAYGKLAITNCEEPLKSVTITFPSKVVGQFYYYYDDTQTELKNTLKENSDKASSVLVLSGDNIANNVFWFSCAPCVLNSGSISFSCVGKTTGTVYERTILLSDQKKISLVQGKVAPIKVDISVKPQASKLPFIDTFDWVINESATDSGTSYDVNTAASAGSPDYSVIEKAYPAGNGGALKLSTGSANGSIATNKLDLSSPFTITVSAKKYNNDETTIRVYVGDDEIGSITNLSETYVDYKFASMGCSSDACVRLVSEKRCYIDAFNVESGQVPPSIAVDDEITGISAEGASDETISISIANLLDWTPTVSCDGAVVSSASLSADNKTITYNVSANTTGAIREGSITVSLTKVGEETISKVILVKQLAGGTHTYTLTISTSGFNTTSYTANNGDHEFYAIANDGSGKMAIVVYSNQIMQSSSVMQWQKNAGLIYNKTDLGKIKSVTISSTAGTFTTNYGTTVNPTSGTTVGNGFFSVKVGSATGKTSSIKVVFEK